jgi:hypothetical protein
MRAATVPDRLRPWAAQDMCAVPEVAAFARKLFNEGKKVLLPLR